MEDIFGRTKLQGLQFIMSMWMGDVPPWGIEVDTNMFHYHSIHHDRSMTGYSHVLPDFDIQPNGFEAHGLVVIQSDVIAGDKGFINVMDVADPLPVAWPVFGRDKPIKFKLTPVDQNASLRVTLSIFGMPQVESFDELKFTKVEA